MTIDVGDVLRVVAVISWLDGDIMQNVFNTAILSGSGPFDPVDVVDDMVDWMDGLYAELASDVTGQVDGSEIRVYIYDDVDDDWDEVGIAAFTWNPSSAVESLPRGVALLLNAKTTDPDVSGKKYFGGLTEASVTDGILTAAVVTAGAAVAVEWFGDFVGSATGATFDPGVWSVKDLAFYPMSGTVIIPSIPAYQRRRKNGIGI